MEGHIDVVVGADVGKRIDIIGYVGRNIHGVIGHIVNLIAVVGYDGEHLRATALHRSLCWGNSAVPVGRSRQVKGLGGILREGHVDVVVSRNIGEGIGVVAD